MAKALKVDYGIKAEQDWIDGVQVVRVQAETARFCVHAMGIVLKKISPTWTEKTRADDIRKEIAAFRVICGKGSEAAEIPNPLYTKLLAYVTGKS